MFIRDKSYTVASLNSKGDARHDFQILKKELEFIRASSGLQHDAKNENIVIRLDAMRKAHMHKLHGKIRTVKDSYKILHGISTLSIFNYLKSLIDVDIAVLGECIQSEAEATANLVELSGQSKIYNIQIDTLIYLSYQTHFGIMKLNGEAEMSEMMELWRTYTKHIQAGNKYIYSNQFSKENQRDLNDFETYCVELYESDHSFSLLMREKILEPFAKRYTRQYRESVLADDGGDDGLILSGAIHEIAMLALFVYKEKYTHISHHHEEIVDIISAVNSLLKYIESVRNEEHRHPVHSLRLTISGASLRSLRSQVSGDEANKMAM